jgi:hypothetical protein
MYHLSLRVLLLQLLGLLKWRQNAAKIFASKAEQTEAKPTKQPNSS